jgi:hypothetical protein
VLAVLQALVVVGQERLGAAAVAVLERRAGTNRHRRDAARHYRSRPLLRLCVDICASPCAIERERGETDRKHTARARVRDR